MQNVFRMKPLTAETIAEAIKKFSDAALPYDPEISKLMCILRADREAVTSRMTSDPFEFLPTQKIWLATCCKPGEGQVKGSEEGIWRSIKNLKLDVKPLPVHVPPWYLAEAESITRRAMAWVVRP